MLTEEQFGTIAVPSEPKLICALPGSGKTHTFISLVQRILDESPYNRVCMVTFTNAATSEMRHRIDSRLSNDYASRVKVGTFGSLMNEQFSSLRGRRKIATGAKLKGYVKRALERLGFNTDNLIKGSGSRGQCC